MSPRNSLVFGSQYFCFKVVTTIRNAKTSESSEMVRTGDRIHIRGCSQELQELFETLKIRLRTRNQAETLMAMSKITQDYLDGKLERTRPMGRIKILSVPSPV